ncbi:glycosyltransferase family 2 protein [Verrucomicrobiota bacterium]
MKKDKISVSIVLGTYNRKRFLKKTLKSVSDNNINVPYEIIAVDGGSTDGTLKYLKTRKDIHVINQYGNKERPTDPDKLQSWGCFMNKGFQAARGKYVCMISDDCLVVPDSIQNGYEMFEKLLRDGRKIGAVAFYWRDWPGRNEYWVGSTLGGKMFVNHGMYLREALETVSWIDEKRYQFYHADGDLCLKMWDKGYEVVDCKQSFIEHYHHANVRLRQSNFSRQKADWKAYLKRWEGVFYNPESDERTGAKQKISFNDPSKMCRQFMILHLFNFARHFKILRTYFDSFIRRLDGARNHRYTD